MEYISVNVIRFYDSLSRVGTKVLHVANEGLKEFNIHYLLTGSNHQTLIIKVDCYQSMFSLKRHHL